MKKIIGILGILFLLGSLAGCDLLGSLFAPQDEIYFWSLFEEDGVHQGIDVERRLSSPFRIIMTRGESPEAGGFDTEASCDSHFSETVFTVTVDGADGTDIIPLDKVSVEHDDGWHIHQEFQLFGTESGETYVVSGQTHIGGTPLYEDQPWSFNLIVR